jgi:hypothetical protein
MDFVIDLDDVWKWLKFSTKQKAKMLLENHFVKDTDYITSLTPQVKQPDHIKGGHNKEIIMLNIATFKKFCLKAGTKKADEIHGRGTCVPPQTPLPNYCGAENQRFSTPLTHQNEGCGEPRSPG